MGSGGGIVRKAVASSYQGIWLQKIWRDLYMSTMQLPLGLRLPKSPRGPLQRLLTGVVCGGQPGLLPLCFVSEFGAPGGLIIGLLFSSETC